MYTVQRFVASRLPAWSSEKYSMVWTPSLSLPCGAATKHDVPSRQRPPSMREVTRATPLPPSSWAENDTVTGTRDHPAGASPVVTGGVVSGAVRRATIARRRPAAQT